MEDQQISRLEIIELTSGIVSAYAANNPIAQSDLLDLIEAVHGQLSGLGAAQEPAVELTPAVPIRKSITDNHLVCLEDGKQLKMLKRHLMTAYNLTPAEYRSRWGLPHDYPMVAPNYSAVRKALAIKIGLGRKAAEKPKAKAKRTRKAKAA